MTSKQLNPLLFAHLGNLMSNVGTSFAKKSVNIYKHISLFSFSLQPEERFEYEKKSNISIIMLQYQKNAICYFLMTTFFPLKGYFQKQNLA